MGKQSFGTLNWLVLIAYLIVMLLIGLSFSKKSSKNSQEFFKATESKVLLGPSVLVFLPQHLAQLPTCRHPKNPF